MRTLAVLFIPAILLIGLIQFGCSNESEESAGGDGARALIGTWTADDTTRFVFAENGQALWIFGDGIEEDTSSILFDYDPGKQPAHLDLSGFERGFLRGRTLYCIVDLESEVQFTLDCEPGGAENSDVRPDTFTHTTMTYRAYPPL